MSCHCRHHRQSNMSECFARAVRPPKELSPEGLPKTPQGWSSALVTHLRMLQAMLAATTDLARQCNPKPQYDGSHSLTIFSRPRRARCRPGARDQPRRVAHQTRTQQVARTSVSAAAMRHHQVQARLQDACNSETGTPRMHQADTRGKCCPRTYCPHVSAHMCNQLVHCAGTRQRGQCL